MGVSSAIGFYLVGIQSAKGAVATTFKRYRVAGDATLAPAKDMGRYTMTDIGRDQGDAYTQLIRVEGDFPVYLHPDGAAVIFYAALGAVVHTGATNYTHTITPADDLPYLTIQRQVGGLILEQYLDCKIGNLRLESGAGGTPICTLSVIGATPTFLAAMSSDTIASGDPYKHWEAKNELKVATVAKRVHTLSYEIGNNLSGFQADDFLYSDVEVGKREVGTSFSLHFTSPTDEVGYREHIFGTGAGTVASPAIAKKAIAYKFTRDVNTSVEIQLPQVVLAGVPVNLSAGGDPLDMEIACEVEKPLASPVTTVIVKDQIATF